MTGIFLAEFGKETAIAGFVRFITTILTGVPSIIAGVFAYGVIVLTFKIFGSSRRFCRLYSCCPLLRLLPNKP